MERAMFHSDGSYKVPDLRARGHCCKTNLPSNTAFRGFGGPQGLMVAESWIEKIATKLGLTTEEVRKRNLYKEGEKTHFNQELTNCTISRCWDECSKMAEFSQQRSQVDKFNANNRWKKRGLAMIPVAAHTLGIDHSKVHIMETGTDTVPNTPPTAASAGSDLNGMAVLEGCKVINSRLEKFKMANPGGTWEDWVTAAFFARVSLSTTGFHATPDIGYDFQTNSGNAFNYSNPRAVYSSKAVG